MTVIQSSSTTQSQFTHTLPTEPTNSQVATAFNALVRNFNQNVPVGKVNADPWIDWSSTVAFTGFSVVPTVIYRYQLLGKTCNITVYATGAGTSNSTVFTITLPFAAANAGNVQQAVIQVVDNSSQQVGMIMTTANSNVATLIKTVNTGTGAWTNTGAKYASFNFTFETI